MNNPSHNLGASDRGQLIPTSGNQHIELETSTGPDRRSLSIAEGKILLLNHPRSCGTAVELFLENIGYTAECNPFDHDYYFFEQRGQTPPAQKNDAPEKKFEVVVDRLKGSHSPSLVRGAGYTLEPHLHDPLLIDLLRNFDHIVILAREPAYALPSHRRTLKDQADALTLEEAGYEALLHLAQLCINNNIQPIIVDAHEIRNNPATILNSLNLPEVQPDSIVWNEGMRARWGTWHEWKTEVSRSDHLLPFTPNHEQEAVGKLDPLFPACQRAYEALMTIKNNLDH